MLPHSTANGENSCQTVGLSKPSNRGDSDTGTDQQAEVDDDDGTAAVDVDLEDNNNLLDAENPITENALVANRMTRMEKNRRDCISNRPLSFFS